MRAALWAAVVLLACPAVAAANVAVVYRPGDPGYARAKFAVQVVHIGAIGAVATGLAWYANARGRARTAAVALLVVFACVMVFFWLGSRTVIAPPDEAEPPPGQFGQFGIRPGPRAVSGEEVTFYAAVASMALAVGGIVAARRSYPRASTPPG